MFYKHALPLNHIAYKLVENLSGLNNKLRYPGIFIIIQ